MLRGYLVFLFLIFGFVEKAISQNTRVVDSLENLIANTSSDSAKVNYYIAISNLYLNKNPIQSVDESRKAIVFAQKTNNKKLICQATLQFAISNYYIGQTDSCLLYLDNCLKLATEINDLSLIANVYLKKGNVYNLKFEKETALKHYIHCLKIREELQDSSGIINANIGIANVYSDLQKIDLSMKYFEKALSMATSQKNLKAQATCLNNLGNLFYKSKDYNKAIDYYKRSIVSKKLINDVFGMSMSYNNIGISQYFLKQYDEAFESLNQSLKIREKMGDKEGMAMSLLNIASLHAQIGNYSKVFEFMNKGLPIAEEIDAKEMLDGAYIIAARTCIKLNKADLAAKYYEKYIAVHDTLFNSNRNKQIEEYSAQFESEKKDKELIKQKAQLKENELNEKRQRITLILTFTILILVIVFSILLFSRLRLIRKQNKIIENQKNMVEEKQKEILDSIHYARRIQMAQIPSDKRVSSMIDRLTKR